MELLSPRSRDGAREASPRVEGRTGRGVAEEAGVGLRHARRARI